MIGLPEKDDLVKIWPFPGRAVQAGPRPVDAIGAGRWLSAGGEEVIWSEFHLEQLRAGDILLHAPPEPKPAQTEEKKAERKRFDPTAAAKREEKHREEAAEAEKKIAEPPAVSVDKKPKADTKDKG